ncbi:MAG: hypothetical protein ACPHP1_04080, partial [Miltoncostaeaceae bacterium]
MSGSHMAAVYGMAAALERADASARVLGARARAARDGEGPAAAFSALATAGPEGLVPAVGTGGALAARHLEQAALAAAAAGPLLPPDVADCVSSQFVRGDIDMTLAVEQGFAGDVACTVNG